MAKKLAENDHQVWVISNKIQGETDLGHKNIKIIQVPPVLKYQGVCLHHLKTTYRGKNGNKLLKTRYTQDNMYQKIIKLYDDVLKS